MNDNMPYAVVADGLVKTYPKGVRALDGLSLRVPAGQIFGLLGPNGAGKTTTIKILSTLARADAGTATVAGQDPLRAPKLVRRAIGVVSQRSGADPVMTGRDNLVLQGRLYGMRGASLAGRVTDLLARFSLTDAANRKVRTYSGGMQRRLDVALGLVHRPQVLFLDEPTTGLDPEARAAMWEEITKLANDGLTILLTTHYLEEADRLADRLAIVDKGRVVVEGTPVQLKGELSGDAMHIELRTTLDEAAVLQRLAAAGVAVATVTAARPSLDDVYLRYAGRRFAEADADEAGAR